MSLRAFLLLLALALLGASPPARMNCAPAISS